MTRGDPLPRLVLATSLAAVLGAGVCAARLGHARPGRPPPLEQIGVILTARTRPTALIVESLSTDGAAQRAGVRVGDVLETVNGRRARTNAEVERDLRLRDPADLRVRRGKTALRFRITAPGNRIGQPDTPGRG